VKITEEELAAGMATFMPKEYATLLAQLDTAIKSGAEDRVNDTVEKITGRKPVTFEAYVKKCVESGVWVKK
jgi:hypothetical protein